MLRAAAILSAALVLAACTGNTLDEPRPTSCNGISSELGGCDPGLPIFIGSDCVSIARQFGTELNRRVLSVIHEPAVVDNESQAVRASQVMSLLTVLAFNRISAIGKIAECDAPEFLAAAEPLFNAELRAKAGSYLYDGSEVDYAAWKEELLRFLHIMDFDEEASPE
ncbi:MAG: hypothetical protein M3P32_03315 [Chloroflexota bacterium]|nr:hypothetical protein [Chloroflexota bacterium]